VKKTVVRAKSQPERQSQAEESAQRKSKTESPVLLFKFFKLFLVDIIIYFFDGV